MCIAYVVCIIIQLTHSYVYATLLCGRYELELADAYARLKQWGPALKKLHDVKRHFEVYGEDLFDFHGYAFRKVCVSMRMYWCVLVYVIVGNIAYA